MVDIIINYSPQNLTLAAIFLLLAYALKSVTVIFPISALQIASGLLFKPIAAFFINLCGLMITLTFPYWIGRKTGADVMERLLKKRPVLTKITDRQKSSPIFLSYFLRVIGCLPGDLVSLYLGACQISYPQFLLGGMLGSGLHLVAFTFLGSAISDPQSPQFCASLVLTLVVSGLPLSLNRFYCRKVTKHSKNET